MRSGVSSSAESAAEAHAFAEHCIDVNASRMWVLLWFLIVTVGVAGPLQYLLLAEGSFWQLVRLGVALAILASVLVAFRSSAALRRHADMLCAGMIFVVVGVEAYTLAQVGGLETLYVSVACITPMMGILFLMPLARRLCITISPAIAFYGVFFLARPSALGHPYAMVPVFHASVAVGLVILFGELNYRLAQEHHARGTWLAGERGRLEVAVRARTAEVLELARNLVSLEETERTRIARELHDELGQELTGARLEAGIVVAGARQELGDEAPTTQRAAGIEARIALAQQRLRDVVFSLRPPALDDFDLATALRMLVDRYRRPGILELDYENTLDGAQLTDTQATTVFRILQEALTNVTRHAAARHARVRIGVQDGRMVMTVADDGRGLPESSSRRIGFGLRGMRERLRLVGGELVIEPGADGGSILRATFPLTTPRSV